MRSHQQAHSGDVASAPDTAEPWSTIDHPLVPSAEPLMVNAQSELLELVRRLRAAGSFAYDSEFIGEHSYHPKLCVIQVALPEHVWLIDPLSRIDLSDFWQLLADASVTKVVHAGMPDLEPVYRHLQVPAQNIFDSQIVAAFAGLGYPLGLAKLVKELAGADLAQGLKFSQWDHRPLSRVQIRYAANDVRYLLLAHALLMDRVTERGTKPWALEECRSLSDVDLYRFDEQSQRVRVRDIESLRPRQRAILANLIAWREQAARNEDVPARTLLKDGLLVDMSRWPPKSLADFNRIKGMPRPVKQLYGQEILDAIGRALTAPVPDDLKRSDRQRRRKYDRDGDRPNVELLWKQMHDLSVARGIDPAIVTSKKEIARHRARAINGDGRDREVRLLSGWRRELLGPLFDPATMVGVRCRGSAPRTHTPSQPDQVEGRTDES